ncbi:MAG TPA: hypothetical protein VL027_01025 [Spongiibacteraceae bacterium]|nr:hypothetical protein [Spongiibacteraceae bacterium]HUH36502.1 hypothetical protein [Spongiibacteraceae bacterium]
MARSRVSITGSTKLLLGLVLLVAMPVLITRLQDWVVSTPATDPDTVFCARVDDVNSGVYPLPPRTDPGFRVALLQALWEKSPDRIRPELERMLRQAQGDPQVTMFELENARARVAAFLERVCGVELF